MAEAKARISLAEQTFEFEGTEAFVSAQLEKFSEVIHAGLKSPELLPKTSPEPSLPSEKSPSFAVSQSSELHEIFAPTEEGVQILKDIPGESKAEKTINAAKLYLYGLSELKQKDVASFGEIGAVCKLHGFHDAVNLASNLKSDQESFVFGGSGRKQTLKLTFPGKKAAVKLIEALRAGSEE